jgi:repressor LexA
MIQRGRNATLYMTKPKSLTKEQVITAINDWVVEKGLPPTIEELKVALGVGSRRTVQRYLAWLEKDGDIQRWPGARGLKLIKHAARTLQTRAIPLVGEAPAGGLMAAIENREGIVQLPLDFLSPSSAEFFLLRVKGDSMNKAVVQGNHIESGDLIVVRQQATAETGQIVVALVDGEATIKRFAVGPGYYILKPESTKPDYSPIVLNEDFQIQGVVVRVLKNGAFNLRGN